MSNKRALTTVGVALLLSTMVASEMLQSPLRVRINTELIKSIFHKKDQEIMQLFDNIQLGEHELS